MQKAVLFTAGALALGGAVVEHNPLYTPRELRKQFEDHGAKHAIVWTKVVGLIALPGTMTGLIIAGVEPLEAIRYQIIVMYMLLAAWAVASLVTARAAERWMFDDAERLVTVST